MKKFLCLAVVMATLMFTGVGIGEEAEKAKKAGKPEVKARKTAPSQAELMREKMRQRGAQPMDPEARMKRFKERYTEELTRAKEGPENTIRELHAIKVVAEKEKAKETVAMLDKLIAKTKKQMDQKVKTIKERQAKLKEFMNKRGDRPTRPSARPGRNEGKEAKEGKHKEGKGKK